MNWVLGAGCCVLSSGYCCWGFWALGSDVQKKHDVGKAGWNCSHHHMDESGRTCIRARLRAFACARARVGSSIRPAGALAFAHLCVCVCLHALVLVWAGLGLGHARLCSRALVYGSRLGEVGAGVWCVVEGGCGQTRLWLCGELCERLTVTCISTAKVE